MNKNILSTLGLCRKAGRLNVGAENTEELIRQKRCRIVFLASDISQNTEHKIRWLCEDEKIDIVKMEFTKLEIGKVIGYNKEVSTVSVGDINFYRALKKKMIDDSNNGGLNK